MPMLSHDMSQVPAAGDLVPEGWYHFRVKHVELKPEEGNRVNLQLAIQDEGIGITGRVVFDNPQLDNTMGLQKVKSYYKAVGYNPGPEGHDPEKLLDGELYGYVQHNTNGDNKYANVMGWSIRSMQQGKGNNPQKR